MPALPTNQRGYLTLVALCFTTVIGLTLAGYLALSYQSLQHSERTLQLARARHLAESGLEEALWSLNNSLWTNATWTIAGANKSCTITGYTLDEGATGQVAITITNYAGTGPVWPGITATATVTPAVGRSLTKTLVATTKAAPLFPNVIGIVTDNNGNVGFSAGGVTTFDSWNSNPSGDNTTFVAYSTPGSYAAAANCAATVAAPSITLNNALIYGYATTFGSSITSTASSKVKGPTTPGGTNIDTARVGRSAFVPAYPVAVPASYSITGTLDGTSQTIGTVGGASTKYYVAASGLTLSGTTITVQGPTAIVVIGDLQLDSGGSIKVNAAGNARVEIFVSGNVSVGVTPHGSTTWLNNLSNTPRNFALYSTSTSSSRLFNYYTNQDFCGVLYSASPSAAVVFDTATSNDFTGAILANFDIDFPGTTPFFHYDTSLQTLPQGWFRGVTTPFIVVTITET